MNTGPAPADQQINNLKHDWDQLSDPDRALAIAQIKKSGLSQREIARRLDCSEATLRRLLSILLAPAADIAAARQGKITTNELLRRAKTALQRQTARRKQAAQIDAQHAARKAADSICRWIIQENISGPDGERIIEEVRREFANMDLTGRIPHVARPGKDVTLKEIIDRCRPAEPVNDNIDRLALDARWLGRWTVFAFPDPDVRDQALELALERQWKR